MRPEMSVGRAVGILLLLQMASALILPFVLMRGLTGGYPDFMEAAARSALQIRSGIGIAFAGASLTVFLGIKLFPVFRQFSAGAALWFLCICAISCVLDAAHNAAALSMLSASERFASAGSVDAAVFQAWGAAVASVRRSAHVVQLVAVGGWMMTFYIFFWRFRLVPRALSILGLAGVAGQFTGVTAMMFLGYPSLGYLAMPLAPVHAATAVWLIAKGFRGFTGREPKTGNESIPNDPD